VNIRWLFIPCIIAGALLLGCDSIPPTGDGYVGPVIDDPVKFVADTQAVRAILDSNGLYTIRYESVTSLNQHGRINGLGLPLGMIKKIPPQIGSLTELEELDAYNNDSLQSLPAEIGLLSKLQILNVQRNALRSLPSSIGNCTLLTSLYIFGNQITSLPQNIGRLTRLSHIEAQDNLLTALPDSIVNLTATGFWVHIANNHLCMVSPAVTAWLNARSFEPDWATRQTCP
jgi:hypothetical protein